MFVDEVEIHVRGGRGGHGCISFRRERFVPRGGPDGADGGEGGSVYLKVDPALDSLGELAGHHHWRAENGRPGRGKNCQGRRGASVTVPVPPGTLVFDLDTGIQIKDLTEPEECVCVARGGMAGRGNKSFATATLQVPRISTEGERGQERRLRLELKLIADVGIVGRPNAGKSTLLSRLTRARPKIASYPFTTLHPFLGIVELSGYRRFVMADIPGLIEGAHQGTGLGDTFLRHIERTRMLLHVVDAAPPPGEPQPVEAYRSIRHELERYSPLLAVKPEVVVANKTDLNPPGEQLALLKDAAQSPILTISAVTGHGLTDMLMEVWKRLEALPQTNPATTPDNLKNHSPA